MPQDDSIPGTPLVESIWRAPLIPVALASTLGILLDRYLAIPPGFSAAATVAALLAWCFHRKGKHADLAFVYLWGACAGVGAIYHHQARDGSAGDDIRYFAGLEPKPARVQGFVASEPNFIDGGQEDALRSFPSTASTRFALEVTQLKTTYDWLPVSGLLQVALEAKIHPVHAGDRVEIVGRLSLPAVAANPGEFDYRAFLRDQGIGALLSVPPSADSIRLLEERWPRTLMGWLAVMRGWGQSVLGRHLPPKVASIAARFCWAKGRE